MADTISKLGYLAGATRFRRISEKLYVDGDKIYGEFGIEFKASWFSIYYTLVHADGPLTVQELSNEIGFTHITVKNVVRELEEAGIARIKANPNDGRSKLISLTTKGRNLLDKLVPVWEKFSQTLEQLLTAGHPDFINIINRIDREVEKTPFSERMKLIAATEPVMVVDYRPSLKNHFYDLAGKWLLQMLHGKLEKEDEFTLRNPEKAYLDNGGFLFFALFRGKVVGCVALKRLGEDSFEFCKLYVDDSVRNKGVATKLIERCITRCKENNAKHLFLQTTNELRQAHTLYYKLGFEDIRAPKEMEVLKRTQKIMGLRLFTHDTSNDGKLLAISEKN
jgi:N-acetylglutamate synthase-like GNAT family acetyltransferase/DNA-binding MarR family transcriptional regulator